MGILNIDNIDIDIDIDIQSTLSLINIDIVRKWKHDMGCALDGNIEYW